MIIIAALLLLSTGTGTYASEYTETQRLEEKDKEQAMQLGYWYKHGVNGPVNYKKALYYFEQAALLGDRPKSGLAKLLMYMAYDGADELSYVARTEHCLWTCHQMLRKAYYVKLTG